MFSILIMSFAAQQHLKLIFNASDEIRKVCCFALMMQGLGPDIYDAFFFKRT